MKHRIFLVALTLVVSLTLAFANDNDKKKPTEASKASCCMDGKKATLTSTKASEHCETPAAATKASMKKTDDCCLDGEQCDMASSTKASVKKSSSTKTTKAVNKAQKVKQTKSASETVGTN